MCAGTVRHHESRERIWWRSGRRLVVLGVTRQMGGAAHRGRRGRGRAGPGRTSSSRLHPSRALRAMVKPARAGRQWSARDRDGERPRLTHRARARRPRRRATSPTAELRALAGVSAMLPVIVSQACLVATGPSAWMDDCGRRAARVIRHASAGLRATARRADDEDRRQGYEEYDDDRGCADCEPTPRLEGQRVVEDECCGHGEYGRPPGAFATYACGRMSRQDYPIVALRRTRRCSRCPERRLLIRTCPRWSG